MLDVLTVPDVRCVDINGHYFYVPVDQLVWRPSAYSIVIKDNKLLVSKRSRGYDLPGGGLSMGETPETAVIRETMEETGIKVDRPELMAIDNTFFKFSDQKCGHTQCLMMYYKCRFVSGELSDTGFDDWERRYTDAPEWYPLDRLGELIVDSSNDFRPYVIEALSR